MRFPHFLRVRRGRIPAVFVSAFLTLPTLAAAQAVNSADLVGEWATDSAEGSRWTFRADSTVTYVFSLPIETVPPVPGPLTVQGRWRLTGNRLKVRVVSVTIKGDTLTNRVMVPDRMVEVAKDKLTLIRYNRQRETYTRVDSLISPAAQAPSTDSSAAPKP